MSDVEQLQGNIARWKDEIATQQRYVRLAVPKKRECRDPLAALEWQKGINDARGIIRSRQASIKEARRVLAMFKVPARLDKPPEPENPR